MYIMGTSKSLVINNTAEHITIKDWNSMYCAKSNSRVSYPGATKNLKPGEHKFYYPSKLKKDRKRKHRVMLTDTEIRISFKDNNSNEGLVLSLGDFERNAGIVLNKVNNQLVRVTVSREEAREEAKKNKETSWFSWNRDQKLKMRLISIADEKIRRSINQPPQDES